MDNNIISIIETVKKHPQIYDASRNDFKNPEKKEKTWKMIANQLQISGIGFS